MKSIHRLRTLVRAIILESMEEDTDLPYEETLLPDEEGKGIVGGPDLAKQPQRDEFLEKRAQRRLEQEEEQDEHAIVGAMGPAWGQVDEYDE